MQNTEALPAQGDCNKAKLMHCNLSARADIQANNFFGGFCRGSTSKRRPLQSRYSRSMTGQDRLVARSEAEHASQQTGSQGGWGKLRGKLQHSKSILDPTRDRKVGAGLIAPHMCSLFICLIELLRLQNVSRHHEIQNCHQSTCPITAKYCAVGVALGLFIERSLSCILSQEHL